LEVGAVFCSNHNFVSTSGDVFGIADFNQIKSWLKVMRLCAAVSEIVEKVPRCERSLDLAPAEIEIINKQPENLNLTK